MPRAFPIERRPTAASNTRPRITDSVDIVNGVIKIAGMQVPETLGIDVYSALQPEVLRYWIVVQYKAAAVPHTPVPWDSGEAGHLLMKFTGEKLLGVTYIEMSEGSIPGL